MRIKEIEKIQDINEYIDAVNLYTSDEVKRCRILLARLLRQESKGQGWECPRCGKVYSPSVLECSCATYLKFQSTSCPNCYIETWRSI